MNFVKYYGNTSVDYTAVTQNCEQLNFKLIIKTNKQNIFKQYYIA